MCNVRRLASSRSDSLGEVDWTRRFIWVAKIDALTLSSSILYGQHISAQITERLLIREKECSNPRGKSDSHLRCAVKRAEINI